MSAKLLPLSRLHIKGALDYSSLRCYYCISEFPTSFELEIKTQSFSFRSFLSITPHKSWSLSKFTKLLTEDTFRVQTIESAVLGKILITSLPPLNDFPAPSPTASRPDGLRSSLFGPFRPGRRDLSSSSQSASCCLTRSKLALYKRTQRGKRVTTITDSVMYGKAESGSFLE